MRYVKLTQFRLSKWKPRRMRQPSRGESDVVSRICFFAVRNYCYEVGLRDYLQDDEKI